MNEGLYQVIITGIFVLVAALGGSFITGIILYNIHRQTLKMQYHSILYKEKIRVYQEIFDTAFKVTFGYAIYDKTSVSSDIQNGLLELSKVINKNVTFLPSKIMSAIPLAYKRMARLESSFPGIT